MHLIETDEGYLELGAQWIHGQQGNPLFHLARDNSLIQQDFEQIRYDDKLEGVQVDLSDDLTLRGLF